MTDDPQNCMIEECTRQAELVLEVGENLIYLCRPHFTQLIARMSRVAERRGSVSLRSLKVERIGNGKVKLVIKRTKKHSSTANGLKSS